MAKGYVYVLRCSNNMLYVGSTRDLSKRLASHQKGKVKTTKSKRPVSLIYYEEFDTYSEACKKESYLKTGTGRDWLKAKLNC